MNFKETEFRPNFLCAEGLNPVSIIDSENSAKYSKSVELDKIINSVYSLTFQTTSTLFFQEIVLELNIEPNVAHQLCE